MPSKVPIVAPPSQIGRIVRPSAVRPSPTTSPAPLMLFAFDPPGSVLVLIVHLPCWVTVTAWALAELAANADTADTATTLTRRT